MKLKAFALAIICLLPGTLAAQINQNLLDKELQDYLDKAAVKGMAVSIVTPDSLLYAKGFGYANQEANIPYTIHTFQPIASITKTIVGVAMMKAQELGKVNLDDDINDYLPFGIYNPHHPDQVITLRHLATHTSGIRDRKLDLMKSYVFEEEFPPIHKNLPIGIRRIVAGSIIKGFNQGTAMPMEVFLKKGYHQEGEWYSKRNFAKERPGAYYEYSNNGTALAALVIEHATGLDFQTFVSLHILEPLGMDQSSWSLSNYSNTERSALYMMDHEIPDYNSVTYPAGGFITNVSEFSKYMREIMQGYQGKGNLLQASSYNEMLERQPPTEFDNGIFWGVHSKSIGHDGWDPGVNTLAYFNKEGSKGLIVFFNTTGYEVDMTPITEVLKILNQHSK